MKPLVLPILDTPYTRHNGGTWIVAVLEKHGSFIVLASKSAQDAERYAGQEVEEDDPALRKAIIESGPWVADPEQQEVIFDVSDITALQLIQAIDGFQVTIAIKGETVAIQTPIYAAAAALYDRLVVFRYGIAKVNHQSN
ncbi:MAG: hypothetical protein ACWA44_02355 [Thiotrichales bacterium]